jgi:hypothetical protein
MRQDEAPIANPCAADWRAMTGDDQRRHCALCQKQVHDLSAMTERSARSLLRRSPGVCVRYRCRADGTIVHRELRPGTTLLPRVLAVAGVVVAAAPAWASPAVTADDRSVWDLLREKVAAWLAPAAAPEQVWMGAPPPPPEQVVMGEPTLVVPEERAVMGKVAAPPPATPAPAAP